MSLGRTIAHELLEEPELRLADPANPETLDLIIACILATYDLGTLYLHALNARRVAARSGGTVELMRWVKAVSHARTVVFADAAVSASAALAAPTEGKATSLLLRADGSADGS